MGLAAPLSYIQPRVAASVEDMLADKSIDAIMIVTPNFTHAELLEKVATAGKHCVVEKPLDSDLGKIERMREALAKLPQPLPYISVGFPKRHDDSVKAMRSTLLSGSIGPLESLIVHHRDLLPQPVECECRALADLHSRPQLTRRSPKTRHEDVWHPHQRFVRARL